MASPLPSKDGKKLFVGGSTLHGTLSRYDRRRGEFLPFFSGLSAEITTLQRRKVDRLRYLSCRKSLAQPGGRQRAAPDGKQIAFWAYRTGMVDEICTVPADGGTPQPLVPENSVARREPNWSPKGDRILFEEVAPNAPPALRLLDLQSHAVSSVPGSVGYAAPHSPGSGYCSVVVHGVTQLLFDCSFVTTAVFSDVSGFRRIRKSQEFSRRSRLKSRPRLASPRSAF